MSPGVPYVSVRSNDVLNGSLDLVLRLCTHVDAVWRVLRPGREVRNFLLDPLRVTLACTERSGVMCTVISVHTVHMCVTATAVGVTVL